MSATAPHPNEPITHERLEQERVDNRAAGTRSITGLFADLWRETSTLFRQEAALAKAELSEKVGQVQSGFAELAAGGAVLFAGFLVLLFAAVGAIAEVLPEEYALWLAPLIVGVVVMLVGWALIASARSNLKAANLKPTRTMDSLRADGRMAKEQFK